MSIFKALFKLALRTSNENQLKSDTKKAQRQAYYKTGLAIKRAKKSGKHIDGKEVYSKNYKKAMEQPTTNSRLRESFINDL
jgi:ribosomal protein S4